jgi:TetR/AcrR family transcriptional repressor of nem operon
VSTQTKEVLVEALAKRYLERVRQRLGDPGHVSARTAIKRLADIFVHANETEDRMCLCGLLAAESGALPERLLPQIAAFFALICEWLDAALSRTPHAPKSIEIIAALEGAILIARIRRDPSILRAVIAALQARARE